MLDNAPDVSRDGSFFPQETAPKLPTNAARSRASDCSLFDFRMAAHHFTQAKQATRSAAQARAEDAGSISHSVCSEPSHRTKLSSVMA